MLDVSVTLTSQQMSILLRVHLGPIKALVQQAADDLVAAALETLKSRRTSEMRQSHADLSESALIAHYPERTR